MYDSFEKEGNSMFILCLRLLRGTAIANREIIFNSDLEESIGVELMNNLINVYVSSR